MHIPHSPPRWNSFLRFVGSLQQVQLLDGPPHITPLRVNGGRSSFPVTAGVQSLHYAGRPGKAVGRLLPFDQHPSPVVGWRSAPEGA